MEANTNEIDPKSYIFGSIFGLSNKLELLCNKIDPYMTIKQWFLICMIQNCGHPEPTISEVAHASGVSRQNVKKMALILEKQGFVKLNRDAADARILRLSLTPKCPAYFENRAQMEKQFMENLYRGLDDTSISSLHQGLMKLTENVFTMEDAYGKEEQD